jgi:hypothetical protein
MKNGQGRKIRKEKESGAKEKGQNISGSFFTNTGIPVWKKKFSPIELQYHSK